jgi:site-specific DNA-methyltransferase (adenine-specific)
MPSLINPFYARSRTRPQPVLANLAQAPSQPRMVRIGPATLYHGDCFAVMPTLDRVGAVVTDPPYGIGYRYRSYDDNPALYDQLMLRLIPALDRLVGDGPCFLWQSPSKAHLWPRYLPPEFRIIAAVKTYAPSLTKLRRFAWDPILFWSKGSWLSDHLPKDWFHINLGNETPDPANPVPSPKPLSAVQAIVNHLRREPIFDPFMGSGTTGVAALMAGKRFIGVEQDPIYFTYACRRIQAAWASITPSSGNHQRINSASIDVQQRKW